MKTARRVRLTALLVGISLPGVLLIAWQAPGMVAHLDIELPPSSVLIAAAAVQSLVLVAVAAALGTWIAPKVGLGAPALEGWVEGRASLSLLVSQARVALPVGFAMGLLMVAAEALAFRPYLPDELYLLGTPITLGYLLSALAYGGIVEEVLLRWGVMSLLAWLIFLLVGRRGQGASLLAGNVLAALLFGLGHLPAVSVLVGELTTPIIVRTVVLNAVPGFIFGMFFQRRGLEAAMFAHMGVHLGMATLRLLFAP